MNNYIIFNNYNSKTTCGLSIEKRPRRGTPVRDVTVTHIPGRDGDLIQDNGSWNNVDITYEVGCSDIDAHIASIRQMLASVGYQRLRDTYDPDFYRLAAVKDGAEFEEDLLNFGHAKITFTADPYRYQVSSSNDTTITSTRSATLANPYAYKSKPLLTIFASAGSTVTIMVNSASYLFTMPPGESVAMMDCATETIYNMARQSLISGYGSDSFPELAPGNNTVYQNSATSVAIAPRWRCL